MKPSQASKAIDLNIDEGLELINHSEQLDHGLSGEKNRSLIIACGALAKEIIALKRNLGDHIPLDLICLPAKLHNYPQKIIPELQKKIERHKESYQHIYIGYADCGTGGALDRFIEEYGLKRLPGPHCYSFFAGAENFDALAEEELGTFYLTDYLAKSFDHLIIEGMGIDRHPELQEIYFGHYKKLIYLAQSDDAELDRLAELAAKRLNLNYQRIYTGYGELQDFINDIYKGN